ncbi:uncharacterized protein PFL1_05719 [Pseudozyma flocculosa PF-1]|nr:uncharacterized protein PFL1_05719 [Pseudozyma flocculosa PF-1]EPQ26740.1 hypothetical protein PFL1_05719 [Pseudozyma flocculosa PF-1]
MPGNLSKMLDAVRRAPSTAANRLTDVEPEPEQAKLLHSLASLTSPKHVATLSQAVAKLTSGQPVNDRELLLDKVVGMLQELPDHSPAQSSVANALIGGLYRDLPHPPRSVCGPDAVYRSADGSGNDLWFPDVGKAGTCFVRGVPPRKPKPPTLPEPELVYDQLLRRPERSFVEHPSGLNRLFFAFASLLSHERFQGSRETPHINDTSSYADLSIIYGNTQPEQDRVRTFENGTIFPDTIASRELLLRPPSVVTIAILFARYHNHLAGRIYEIDEQGLYKSAAEADVDHLKWQDEDIFQKARNVNVATFANVIVGDFLAAILDTLRADSSWTPDLGGKSTERQQHGTGDAAAAESSLLYRWFAAASASDDCFMQETLHRGFPKTAIDDIAPQDFWGFVSSRVAELDEMSPSEWTFGNGQFTRNAQGTFDSRKLAELIMDSIEEPGHAFGARSSPSSHRLLEIAGIRLARDVFGVATLNEFRAAMNLTTYKSFQEWNPSEPQVALAAERLYGHIDDLELYPGLMAEETKPPGPGSGLCCGYTTSRAVFEDLISLIRSDRFLTFDRSSATLTSWGVGTLAPVPGAYGGSLATVLFATLPGAWPGTSSFAMLPFHTNRSVRKVLADNKALHQYDVERPTTLAVRGIYTFAGCSKAMEDRQGLQTLYDERTCAAAEAEDERRVHACYDRIDWNDERARVFRNAFYPDGFEVDVHAFFDKAVPELINASSVAYRDGSRRRQIDIIRDVCNVAPIIWIAQRFAFPLKTEEHPRGLIGLSELFHDLMALYLHDTFHVLPRHEWKLRDRAVEASQRLADILKAQIRAHSGLMEPLVDWLARGTAYDISPDAERLFHSLLQAGLSGASAAWSCVHVAAALAGSVTQLASRMIDFYLDESRAEERGRITELAISPGKDASDELEGFVLEAMRLAPIVPGLPRRVTRDFTFEDSNREIDLKRGDMVLIATSQASMDAAAFPAPDRVDPFRPRESYDLLERGIHSCFGARLVVPSLVSILRQVFRLKGLRRVTGKAGMLARTTDRVGGIPTSLYLDRNAAERTYPASMLLEYASETALIPREEAKRAGPHPA